MRYLAQTSVGPIIVAVEGIFGYPTLTLYSYDADGWESRSVDWHKRDDQPDGPSLASCLADLSLPVSEAEKLAAQLEERVLAEWVERGGDQDAQELRRFAGKAIGIGVGIVLLAVVGAMLLFLLLVKAV